MAITDEARKSCWHKRFTNEWNQRSFIGERMMAIVGPVDLINSGRNEMKSQTSICEINIPTVVISQFPSPLFHGWISVPMRNVFTFSA